MTLVSNNITLNKLRSYSSVFSSTSFSKLLQYDDYTFIDAKIVRYDLSKVGIKFHTYFDYIQYIYKELTKHYRNEYVYKNTFINDLLIDKYGVKDTLTINEFRVGNSIADLVMFNGTSKAFEIKTELDSNIRLTGQLADYSKLFKECYVITHESLIDKYLQEDTTFGIIELIERPRSIIMREIRKAKENKLIDVDILMRSIRTSEYKNIAKKYFRKLPEMNSFNMYQICKDLLEQIPNDKLNNLFIEELKNRKSNTEIIKSFSKEIRQLCLAMNLNASIYQQLDKKLSKPIIIE